MLKPASLVLPFSLLSGGSLMLLAIPGVALARWEKVSEAGAVGYEKAVITINKDGTSSTNMDQVVEIKLDAARTNNGTASFWYNAAASRLGSLQAETMNGKKVQKVGKDHIEDKAERGQDLGFDKIDHVSIAFPEVAVGSKLHYNYTLETHTVPVAGLFDEASSFGSGNPDIPPTRVTYRSLIPLQLSVDDPDHYLAVVHRQEGNYDVVDVQLLRPVYFKVVNESSGGYFLKPPNPSVYVSTFKDWGEIGKVLSTPYEAELTRPLPPSFMKIAEKAKGLHTTFVERANEFTSALADLVRYQGDWRTVKGGHVPRHLETIAETAFGDCKDMALVTAAALRWMGYKANIALIYRGEALPFEVPLPTIAAFNHAIVRAEDEQGHVQWVDATNRVSRAQGIRADIAGRPALVVDIVQSRLERTPAFLPSDYVFSRKSELNIKPEVSEVSAHHRLHFGAAAAENVTGWELAGTKEEIDEVILRDASDGNQVFSHSIAPYDLKSRVVKDADFDVTVRSKIVLTETTAGHAFSLYPGHASLAKLDLEQRVSGVPLGKPETYESLQVLQNAELIGEAPEPCSFESKWMQGERRIEASDDKVTVSQRYSSRTYGITAEDLRTTEFAQFQEKLRTCFGAYSVVFKKSSEDKEAESLSH